MSSFKQKFNPISGQLNLVSKIQVASFKDAVASQANLPLSGNTQGDARITNDTQNLYVWSKDASTGILSDWANQGNFIDLDWSLISSKPTSSVSDIDSAVSNKHTHSNKTVLDSIQEALTTLLKNAYDSAVSLKHSNSLDHTQGTDQGLDTGGTNAVTAAQAKTGYSHSQVAHAPSDAVSLATVKADTDIDNAIDNAHAPHSDDQVIPTALSALSDDSTHRLVTDTEKGTWNGKADKVSGAVSGNFASLDISGNLVDSGVGSSSIDAAAIAKNFYRTMLLFFYRAVDQSKTVFNLLDGFMDEYEDESGIDLVNSINQIYDAVNDYYKTYGEIDSYTKLLLHLDNNITDSETIPKTVTNNNVTFSDTIKKFGTHSASFNGSNAYLSVPDSADWDLGTGDFTIDFWFNTTTRDSNQELIMRGFGDQEGRAWEINYNSFYKTINIMASYNAGIGWNVNLGSTAYIAANTWIHVAMVRYGNVWSLYINGVLQNSTTISATINDVSTPVYIGVHQEGNIFANYFNGNIDEVRVSKGIARWTEAFTPPSSAYHVEVDNIILISNTQVAEIVPTEARIILFEEDVDVITLNTDIKAYISRDNGVTYSQVTLEDEGNYDTTKRIISGLANVSSQPSDTDIVYKIETLNNKNLHIHATALAW